jgi:hypothetical protein
MDIIQSCLVLAPVPYLAPAFSIFKVIWESIDQIQASNEQLRTLSCSIAQLLSAINGEYRRGALKSEGTSEQLEKLREFVSLLSTVWTKLSTPKVITGDFAICREAVICKLCDTIIHKG